MYSVFLLYGIDTNLKNIPMKVNGYQIPELTINIYNFIVETLRLWDTMIVKNYFSWISKKTGGSRMKRRKFVVVSLMVLGIAFIITSCTTLEKPSLSSDSNASQTIVSPKDEESALPSANVDWFLTAEGLDAEVGDRLTLQLPPNGTASRIWGTEIYTGDSSIGSAAVHMGLVSFAAGGEVTILIEEGASSYKGTSSNGVTSESYGEWGLSFVFLDEQGNIVRSQPSHVSSIQLDGIDWSTNATDWEQDIGARYTIDFPPGGDASSVWGTTVYTSDSSIGTAAVHAGLISFDTGGRVTIEIVEGQMSYEGSSRYGVDSSSYEAWGGSFKFVK